SVPVATRLRQAYQELSACCNIPAARTALCRCHRHPNRRRFRCRAAPGYGLDRTLSTRSRSVATPVFSWRWMISVAADSHVRTRRVLTVFTPRFSSSVGRQLMTRVMVFYLVLHTPPTRREITGGSASFLLLPGDDELGSRTRAVARSVLSSDAPGCPHLNWAARQNLNNATTARHDAANTRRRARRGRIRPATWVLAHRTVGPDAASRRVRRRAAVDADAQRERRQGRRRGQKPRARPMVLDLDPRLWRPAGHGCSH